MQLITDSIIEASILSTIEDAIKKQFEKYKDNIEKSLIRYGFKEPPPISSWDKFLKSSVFKYTMQLIISVSLGLLQPVILEFLKGSTMKNVRIKGNTNTVLIRKEVIMEAGIKDTVTKLANKVFKKEKASLLKRFFLCGKKALKGDKSWTEDFTKIIGEIIQAILKMGLPKATYESLQWEGKIK